MPMFVVHPRLGPRTRTSRRRPRCLPWTRLSLMDRVRNVHQSCVLWKLDSRIADPQAPFVSKLGFRFMGATSRILSLNDMRANKHFVGFLYHLSGTAALEATDPRDKIYGILGLSTPAKRPQKIIVEYSKSIQEVFQEAAFQVILEPWFLYGLFSLHHLRRAHAPHATTIAELPSWATDFTMT
ncbi:hypothetical protein BU23DRAFT_656992, partial [Bimuria novae-zelandiae CBS 107.79]